MHGQVVGVEEIPVIPELLPGPPQVIFSWEVVGPGPLDDAKGLTEATPPVGV